MSNFNEKDSLLYKVLRYLIPWKGDRPAEIVRKVVFIVSAAVLTISLVNLLTFYSQMYEDSKNNDELSDLFHGSGDDTSSGTDTTIDIDVGTQSQGSEEKEPAKVLDSFVPLLRINEDIVGWITMGDEEDPFIDYVVVQGEDNSFYLTHNYKKEESVAGSVFADYRQPITADSEPANIILYGHNLASGEYFAKLTRYFNYRFGGNYGLDFYKEHPTFTFSTLYEKHTYKIFGGMLVNTQESEGDVFYYLEGQNFKTKAEFDDYVAQMLDRSTFYTDVDLMYGDRLMTLSTCIRGYSDWDMRWVLFARRVRDGEDASVDVSKAYENPNPLYFDAYYSLNGGKWEGRKWPAEMIYGYTY